MKIFPLEHSREWGEKVAPCLDTELAQHEERDYEDGEHKVRPLEIVSGQDVYVIHSLFSQPGQNE